MFISWNSLYVINSNMVPLETPRKKCDRADVRPGRYKKKPGRPMGARNKEKINYNFELIKYAIETDLHMTNIRNTGTDKEKSELPYNLRRDMCKQLSIPESTVSTRINKLKKSDQPSV